MIPFAKELGTVYGIQIYVLASLFLLIVFSYLLYFHLSKSRTLAFLISLFVLYSVNIYGSFTWGGSLPFFATQFFLPLVLLLASKYLETQNSRWFFAAILTTGLGFFLHPLPIFAFVVPTVSILLFVCLKVGKRNILSNLFERFRKIVFFVFGSLIVALPISWERLLHTFIGFLGGGPGAFFSAVVSLPAGTADGVGGGAGGVSEAEKFYH